MEKVYQYTITEQEIFENVFKDEKLLMNHVYLSRREKVFQSIRQMRSYMRDYPGRVELSN